MVWIIKEGVGGVYTSSNRLFQLHRHFAMSNTTSGILILETGRGEEGGGVDDNYRTFH